MDKSVEKYIADARKSGMDDEKIKKMLIEAGWVPDQIGPILLATQEKETTENVAPVGPKQHFSIRKMPDLFMDYVWKKIF